MGLRDIEATLPPGFRFYPSDEELVCHYLYNKIANDNLSKGTMVEVDLHTCEPWQLPDVAKMGGKEWYFFSYRERKYATGLRTNRATSSGYWKATGKDKPVYDSSTGGIVGMRKTLVFYRDRAPNGIKTGWIMHEFRLDYMPPHLHNNHLSSSKDWVLCRVFHKSKGELGTKLSLENEFEQSMMDVSYGILDQTMQEYEYPQLLLPQCSQLNINANVSSNSNLPNLEGISPGFLLLDQEPNEKITSTINVIDFKRCGEYGYLFDMDLDS